MDVIPFLILSMSRSGTQFLSALLRSHPAIVAHGEVLNPLDVSLDDSTIIARAFGAQPDSATIAAGITILGEQLMCRPMTLANLLSIPDMRVIVLERLNQVERLRSAQQAGMLWHWGVDAAPVRGLPVVHLHPEQTYRALQEATVYYSQLRYQVRNQRRWIYFEDLVADHNSALDTVWSFLGVEHPSVPLPVPTVRQEHRPLSETVANIDHLQNRLAGTQYEHLLEEAAPQ